MRLNDMAPAPGSRRPRRRVGRGIGSGLGKTAGRGHKGQKSRSGGFHKVGFEGGQMPLQRRLPKRGFRSLSAGSVSEIRTGDLSAFACATVDVAVLKAAGLVGQRVRRVRLILSGDVSVKVEVKGIEATRGAKAAIEAAGGSLS